MPIDFENQIGLNPTSSQESGKEESIITRVRREGRRSRRGRSRWELKGPNIGGILLTSPLRLVY